MHASVTQQGATITVVQRSRGVESTPTTHHRRLFVVRNPYLSVFFEVICVFQTRTANGSEADQHKLRLNVKPPSRRDLRVLQVVDRHRRVFEYVSPQPTESDEM